MIVAFDYRRAFAAELGINDAGDAVLAWLEEPGEVDRWVWTARHTFEEGWSEGELLGNYSREWDLSYYVRPAVAVADDGFSMALWTSEESLLGSSSAWGEEWGPVESVPNPERALQPKLAIDDNNTLVAVWGDRVGNRWYDEIWSNVFTPREGWGSPVRLAEAGGAGLGGAALSMNRSGNAVAVWGQAPPASIDLEYPDWESQQCIWASRFEAGTGWTAPEKISTGGCGCSTPEVAIDPQGNAIAVWLIPGKEVIANRFTVGVGWGTAEVIADEHASDPSIGMDDEGNAIAVWGGIWSSRYTIAAGWGAPERISDPGSRDGLLAVGSAGDAVAVWEMDVSTWSNRYVPGVGWGQPELVTDFGFPVDVAVDRDGNALVVWASKTSFVSAVSGLWSSTSHRPP